VKTFVLATLFSLLSWNVLAANKPAARPLPATAEQQPAQTAPSPVIATMSQELDREMPILSKATPPAYFISYILTSTDRSEVMGSNGALLSSEDSRSRWLETQVRVGSYDSRQHAQGRQFRAQPGQFRHSVPIDDAPDVLRRAMWQETDKQFRVRLGRPDQDQYQQGSAGANGRGACPGFCARKAARVLWPRSFRSSRPQALGRKSPPVHARVSRVAANPEFHRDVQRDW
jgi:hypothetical protein